MTRSDWIVVLAFAVMAISNIHMIMFNSWMSGRIVVLEQDLNFCKGVSSRDVRP